MSEAPIRFGLIGFGAWGQLHAQCIAKTAGAELAAIAAASDETCKKAAEAYPNAKVVQDYRQLIDDPSIEVCDIVLPSHLHFDVASYALRNGKHLLLEKPMALTVADCDALVKLADDHHRVLAVGHELRLSSMWGKAKAMVDDGFLGDPLYALVELSRKPYRQGASGWRYDINRVGNWVLEEPIHFFDLARWYLSACGDPTTIHALANSRQEGHPELQDNFSALMSFSNGAYANISQTLCAFEHHQTVKLTGTKGALWASWSGAMDRTLHPSFSLKAFDGEVVQEVPIDKITGEIFELEDQMAMMVAAIRHGQPVAATGLDGKWSVAMCVAAQESIDRGLPVNLSEVMN